MSHPTVQFDRVSFGYGHRPVLGDASFSLRPGSATALIGPNGVGKSTLLRLASGVLRPASGTVSILGQPLTRLGRSEAARIVALLPQQLDVPFPFTVEDLVAQGRTPFLSRFGTLRRQDHLVIDEVLTAVGLVPLRHRIYGELSGGERQLVKLAMALAQQPRLLLLDEPTQNLDIGRQAHLLDLLDSLRGQGVTLLAAMHDLHLIGDHFEEVLMMTPEPSLVVEPAASALTPQRLGMVFDCHPPSMPWLQHIASNGIHSGVPE